MNTTTVEFVGGPLDGQHFTVEADARYFAVEMRSETGQRFGTYAPSSLPYIFEWTGERTIGIWPEADGE